MKTFQKPAFDQLEKVNELIKNRYSPRAFTNQPLSEQDLTLLIEAARWAPSSMNAQPWKFFISTNDDDIFSSIWQTLSDGNKPWAKKAAAFIVTFIPQSDSFPVLLTYAHDLGLAIGNLSLQAESMHIGLHQMGGFSKDAVAQLFEIGSEYIPMTIIAVGKYGNAESLEEPYKSREKAMRTRKPINELFIK